MLHAPDEDVLANIASVFSPRETPDRFVALLARWVDVLRLFDSGSHDTLRSTRENARPGIAVGRLRELTAVAAKCTRMSGTSKGLLTLLAAATGSGDFRIEENVDSAGHPRPFHILVRAPVALSGSRLLIERILQSEKPACSTCEFLFQD